MDSYNATTCYPYFRRLHASRRPILHATAVFQSPKPPIARNRSTGRHGDGVGARPHGQPVVVQVFSWQSPASRLRLTFATAADDASLPRSSSCVAATRVRATVCATEGAADFARAAGAPTARLETEGHSLAHCVSKIGLAFAILFATALCGSDMPHAFSWPRKFVTPV